ncbi:MAG: hypothetical protein RL417_2413 [Pseudomonadota bacterium]|jgi:hypothetical protein
MLRDISKGSSAVASCTREPRTENTHKVTTIIETVEDPGYAFCALPPHFFERSLAGGAERGASISLQSWQPASTKSR